MNKTSFLYDFSYEVGIVGWVALGICMVILLVVYLTQKYKDKILKIEEKDDILPSAEEEVEDEN